MTQSIMSMSLYAKRSDYDREQAQRDLNPHKPARFAMWLWGARYARTGKGSMGFWDSLNDSEQDLCRRAVAEIAAARDE